MSACRLTDPRGLSRLRKTLEALCRYILDSLHDSNNAAAVQQGLVRPFDPHNKRIYYFGGNRKILLVLPNHALFSHLLCSTKLTMPYGLVLGLIGLRRRCGGAVAVALYALLAWPQAPLPLDPRGAGVRKDMMAKFGRVPLALDRGGSRAPSAEQIGVF